MADLLTASGADRILTMDLHAAQIQGFFNIPVDHLFAAPVLLEAIRKLEIDDLVIVSPDVGGVARARAIGKRLGASLAIIDKRRTGKNETEVLNVIGDVEGRDVLILDDIIDTAGTLVQAEEALRAQGARRVVRRRRAPGALRPGARPDRGVAASRRCSSPTRSPSRRPSPAAPGSARSRSPRCSGRPSSASTKGLPFPPFLCRIAPFARTRRAGKAMKTIELNVERRTETGKNEARRTRAKGKIPAVVYGAGKPTVPIHLERQALTDAFRAGAGENAIFLLKLAGSDQSRHAMIREFAAGPGVPRAAPHRLRARHDGRQDPRQASPIEVVGVARASRQTAASSTS